MKNFHYSLPTTKMSPTCLVMTKRKDTPHLIIGSTPPKNFVRVVLKQIKLIPTKTFTRWKNLYLSFLVQSSRILLAMR